MNDKDKRQLARLRTLEFKEKEQKNKDDLQEIQQIVDSCVFHYTNAGTLVGMLKNASIENPSMTFWASHTSYMNDPKEKEYGIEKMWEILPEVENELSIPVGQRITELDREDLDQFILERNIEENSLTNVYSISFSKSFDSLPMWNMYGQNGNGICLGFDLMKLNEFLISKNMEPLKGLTYGIGEEISNIQKTNKELICWKEYIKYVYKTNRSFIEKHMDMNSKSKEYTNINIALDNYIALLAIVPGNVKIPAYKYENEYRLYCRELNHKVCFRDRNGLLVPYIEMELPLDALKLIEIGPTADKNRQMMSVAKLLKEKVKDFKALTFYSSEIPYCP